MMQNKYKRTQCVFYNSDNAIKMFGVILNDY